MLIKAYLYAFIYSFTLINITVYFCFEVEFYEFYLETWIGTLDLRIYGTDIIKNIWFIYIIAFPFIIRGIINENTRTVSST